MEIVKRDNRVFVIGDDGVEVPRKEWVIAQFEAGQKRGDIAKSLGVPVQTVYGYTKGLVNEFHSAGGQGRSGGTKVVVVHPLTGVEMARSEVIRDLYAGGMGRGEIAKLLETSYQVVYGLTRKPSIEVDGGGDIPEDEVEAQDEDE